MAEGRGGSRWTELYEDARLFLDTALTMLVEHELYIEGAQQEKPVPVVPSPWFDGAKALVEKLREAGSVPVGEPDASEKDHAFKRGWAQGYAAGEDSGGEPDDERLIERVGEAIEGASPIHLEAASPGWADDVARAAVAAVRAAGGTDD